MNQNYDKWKRQIPENTESPADLGELYTKCFACGKENPIGLKLNFHKEGEMVKAEFSLGELYQGWPGIIHGGILCTVLDEAMGYALVFEGILSYVTARTEMRFRNQVRSEEPLIVTGRIDKRARNLIWTSANIARKKVGTILTEGKAVMFDTGEQFTP